MSIYGARPWDQHWGAAMLRPNVPEHATALDMFREAVRSLGTSPLVAYFDTTLSADDIDVQSDAIGAWLQDSGVNAGDRVALYLQNMPEFIIGLIASWKVGAVPVPINPMYRQRELEELLRDSGSTAIIVLEHLWHEVLEEIIGSTNIEIVITTNGRKYLDSDRQLPSVLRDVTDQPVRAAADFVTIVNDRRGQRPMAVPIGPDDIAFVCYTSGTTGPPKGAMVVHRGVVFNSQSFRNMRDLAPGDIVFALAPLFHITGLICTIALGLLVPMPMVLGYRFDVGESLALIERYKATFTVGATTAFIAFLTHPDFEWRNTSSLTTIICGGAPIPPAVLERYEAATGVYMYNGYGLTETTSPTFGTPTGRRSPVDPVSGALALGIPLPGTDCVLLDDEGREAACNEPGEIVVRGPHVVPGYWQRPDETATAIRDGWLRTGDVAMMDEDGWFYLVDRKKDLINASGYKVWPREVEEVLYEHLAVREAAVVGVPDEYRGETVKAVVSLRPGAVATVDELVSFCKQRLAAYKYPRILEIVDDLPKTASGKILRRAVRTDTR